MVSVVLVPAFAAALSLSEVEEPLEFVQPVAAPQIIVKARIAAQVFYSHVKNSSFHNLRNTNPLRNFRNSLYLSQVKFTSKVK